MAKDAFYFSHDSNAKDDPKCVLLIEQLGLEGYGIYWVLIEMLRDQPGYRYPLALIPAISRRYNTTAEKMRTVVSNYGLFEIDENDFFSLSLLRRMEHLDNKRTKASLAGKKSGAVRALISNVPEEQKEDIPQVYVIKCFNGDEEFIKIGSTTGTISRRFSGHLPYQYTVLRQIFSDDSIALETELQEHVSNYRCSPKITFPGNRECYAMDAFKDVMDFQPKTVFSHERRFSIGSTIKLNESKLNESKEGIIILLPDESGLIATLEQVENYPVDRTKDLKMYKLLQERYPTIDILGSIKSWSISKLSDPLKPNSNSRSQINTWVGNDLKWGKNLKSSGNGINGRLGVQPNTEKLVRRDDM